MLEKNLQRNEAPLTPDQWKQIDDMVTNVARRQLVGRRLINVFGPLGAGVESVHQDEYAGKDTGTISLLATEDIHPVHIESRDYIPLPILFKDFWIYWRDLEGVSSCGIPLDISVAAAAATFVAHAEDNLIFNGDEDLCLEGLMNARLRNTVPMLNWDEPGRAFQNIVNAHSKLIQEDFFGPFALVVSPDLYARMQRVYDNTGVLEINQVRELMTAGVFQTPVLPDNGAVVVSVGAENMDIAIAQDFITAYLGPERMNHPFRVFETLILRIKRPGAICTLESAGEEEKEKSKKS